MKNNYCIIMAGGIGSRFWPLSRNARPKQFLDIMGVGRTLLQITIDRFARILPRENIYIVTSTRYRELVESQAEGIPGENILYEPFRRNTAPCIAYATYKLYSKDPEASVVVAPSDHIILDEAEFENTIRTALDYAADHNQLYTIGIKPFSPNTNFGYIQYSKEKNVRIGEKNCFQVKTFTEKPNYELAKIFVESGDFLWNSGIFIWNLKTIKEEIEQYLPEVAELFGRDIYGKDDEEQQVENIYRNSPSISIDYGVMEKTRKAWIFPGSFGWTDIGTWDSLYNFARKDDKGNAVRASHNITADLEGTIVVEHNPKKLVVAKNLKDVMIVDTDDVLLVCPRSDAAVKEILVDLTAQDKGDFM